MTRFADGRPKSKRQHRSILLNCQIGNVEDLHCLARAPDFDGEPSVVIEWHLPVDLSEDRPEFSGRHHRAIVLGRNVFHLQHRLLPGIGIAAAVQGDE